MEPEVAAAAGGVFQTIANVFEDHFPGEEAKAKIAIAMQELQNKIPLAQVGVDTAEAQNPSVFVSGPRAFVEWMCGIGLANAWFVAPWAYAITNYFGHPLTIPTVGFNAQVAILSSLLAVHTVTTYGKVKGL